MFLLTALFNKRRLLYKKNTEKTKSDMLILIIIELKLYNITDVVSLSYKYKPCKSINKSLYITFRCCCCKADPSFLQLSRSVRVETRELRSQLQDLNFEPAFMNEMFITIPLYANIIVVCTSPWIINDCKRIFGISGDRSPIYQN